MTVSSDMILNSAALIIFNAGGFFYVARTWKKAVNGHLEKLDILGGEIQTEIAKTREDIAAMRGYCAAVQDAKKRD